CRARVSAAPASAAAAAEQGSLPSAAAAAAPPAVCSCGTRRRTRARSGARRRIGCVSSLSFYSVSRQSSAPFGPRTSDLGRRSARPVGKLVVALAGNLPQVLAGPVDRKDLDLTVSRRGKGDVAPVGGEGRTF